MDDGFSTVNDAIAATKDLYARLRHVIPPAEWAVFAPDILAIQRLKKERNAIILAHNYMTPDIYYGVADFVGDSLALARQAATTTADVIVMAGVVFMAETAKVMNPNRTVLMPDMAAGCSLSEGITADDMRALRARYPGVPIVTYVNTSAEVKALADICCTSGNAERIVESLGAPRVIMAPDAYLARNVAAALPHIEIIPWHARCEVHERFTADDISAYRAAHQGVRILAHPECEPTVVRVCDYAGSTQKMAEWIDKEKPAQVMLVTECSMSDNMAVQFPDVAFVRPCHLCPHMKRITLPAIRRALEQGTVAITMTDAVLDGARRSVQRMLDVR